MAKPVKVFGIGFQKTGTTTLGTILERLGYRVAGYHPFRGLAGQDDLDPAEVEALALRLAEDADAAKDTPWPVLYQALDAAFPGSKFIHVVRDEAAWIASAVKDFGDHPNALHRMIYGVPFPKGHEAVWLARYRQHNAEVAAHFAGRPGDYLCLRLEDGVTFEKICAFLGEPLVARGQPHANTRARKRLKMLWWRLTRRT
jgi:Sulfotransferase domain